MTEQEREILWAASYVAGYLRGARRMGQGLDAAEVVEMHDKLARALAKLQPSQSPGAYEAGALRDLPTADPWKPILLKGDIE